jgi:hypothetical protein
MQNQNTKPCDPVYPDIETRPTIAGRLKLRELLSFCLKPVGAAPDYSNCPGTNGRGGACPDRAFTAETNQLGKQQKMLFLATQ